MAHRSDNAVKLSLTVTRTPLSIEEIDRLDVTTPAVYLFLLPFGRTSQDAASSASFWKKLQHFSQKINGEATIAVLTSPPDAATLWIELEPFLRFQLWIAVKASVPLRKVGQLPEHHAALLILTKYNGTLRHTKTRIGYTYCPACEKTTKDYGGKKHTYHEYGTLMSDVWRDISYDSRRFPRSIVSRLRDIFGLPPYNELVVYDLREITERQPRRFTPASCRSAKRKSLKNRPTGLIVGDCLGVLRTIPSESVDFCFADPPYNLKKKYDSWEDTLDIHRYFDWCDEWLTELARILKPGRTCAVLNIPQWAIRHFAHLRKLLDYQSWIVWEGLSLPVRMIMPAHYSVICFSKGKARDLPGLAEIQRSDLEDECLRPLAEFYCSRSSCKKNRWADGICDTSPVTDLWWDIHRLKHNKRRVDHPCQLPPTLMRRVITLYTLPGELILDPFNGAGTTTLVAEQLGRQFIGIELSEQYHSLAVGRHEELRLGIDPFRKTDSVPKSKNSYVKRLKKQQYVVSKKALQLEVKRISRELGHLPSRDEVKQMSEFSIEYYEKYFISWGEVCAAARTTGMSEYRHDDPRVREANEMPLFGIID